MSEPALNDDEIERQRAFAYWQEWIGVNGGKLDAIRIALRDCVTKRAALSRVEPEEEVGPRFDAYKDALHVLQLALESVIVDPWMPDDYRPKRWRDWGSLGQKVAERPKPGGDDTYLLYAWLGETDSASRDIDQTGTEFVRCLDGARRTRPQAWKLRSAGLARSVADLRFHVSRINPDGWIDPEARGF